MNGGIHLKSKKLGGSMLLTGASGFAGAHMLKYLMEETNFFVYCPVTYSHGGHPNRINSLIPSKYQSRYSLFLHDLASRELNTDDFYKDIDIIINFASESHVDRSISFPLDFVRNNTNLMINLLEFARKPTNDIAFLHISTDEVYGTLEVGEQNIEWQRAHLPSNPYSASKSAQENLAISYFKTYGLNLGIINATNMLGEAQNQEKFIPKSISKIISGEMLNVDTDIRGQIGSRKYIYVGDVTSAVGLAIKQIMTSRNNQLDWQSLPARFHVSGLRNITNLEVLQIIGKHLDRKPNFRFGESPRKGYDLNYELNSNKIRGLGWQEAETIETRLYQIVDWTLAHPEWLVNDHKFK